MWTDKWGTNKDFLKLFKFLTIPSASDNNKDIKYTDVKEVDEKMIYLESVGESDLNFVIQN